MKIVIPGGSGLLGSLLARELSADGHEIVVLSRRPMPSSSPSSSRSPWRVAAWDGRTVGGWASELEDADAVINLAGQSVNCRYGAGNRRAILDSRIESTRAVGRAIASAARPPRVWLQASTATIYAHRYDAANDEATGLLGGSEAHAPSAWRFSIDVARAWEQTALEAETPRTRMTLLRAAIVMSEARGSAFGIFSRLARFGLGGAQGDGRQYVSWIHGHDFVRAVKWLLDHELAGPVNLASPNPIPNVQFMRMLREAWGISWGLPASRWMLEFGAVFLRTETELVLKSRRVVPTRLVESGFRFEYPTWPLAATDLCRRAKTAGGSDVGQAAGLTK